MRSREKKQLGVTGGQYPLLRGELGKTKYMAYSFGDISSTVEKMPTPCEGRGLWMDKLAELTTGVTLALGDFRAIAQTMMSRAELQEIEGSAKTLILPDHTRFTAL